MKLILTTLLLLSIALGSDRKEAENANTIAHEQFVQPEAFDFGNSFYLDVNKDGTNDFLFTTVMVNDEGSIHTKYLVNSLGKNEVLTVDGSAAINEEGSNINEFGNEKWSTASGEIIEQVIDANGSSWNGTWSGDRDQFIGIKFVMDGKSYNGWVKLSIDPINETAFVHGYAINRTPNGNITAGQI